jgi:small subunit ribosomal protein S14
MANRSSIERNNKRIKLSAKYATRRQFLKQQKKSSSISLEEKYLVVKALQLLPRNSAPTRIYRRCSVTGRPRAVYRDFGLSRHVLREMAHECLLPGVVKASW